MSLDKLTTSLGSLQSSLNLTQANVTAVKNQINSTFSKADCINCTSLKPELDKLTLDTSITVSTAKKKKAIFPFQVCLLGKNQFSVWN